MVTKPKACHDVTVCNESRSVQRGIFDGKIDVRESHDPYDKTEYCRRLLFPLLHAKEIGDVCSQAEETIFPHVYFIL